MKSLRVASSTFSIRGETSLRDFFQRVEGLVTQAKSEKAELLVLPELLTLDCLPACQSQHEENQALLEISKNLAPRYFESLQKLSNQLQISIQGGTTPRWDPVAQQIRNTAILTFPNQAPVFQDKIRMTYGERVDWGWTNAPGRPVSFDSPWGKTVILICHDAEFPSHTAQLSHESPEIILVPSCTGSLQGFHRVRWCAQARAIEHYCFVVSTGTVGPGTKSPGMRDHWGQASIIAPSDEHFSGLLAESKTNEEHMIVAECLLDKLRTLRPHAKIFPARDEILC
jgi:predicted amidohydrolase